MKILLTVVLAATAVLGQVTPAFAREKVTRHSERPVFYYGATGFMAGALLGASAGYISGSYNEDWDQIIKGAAYGAIAGAGLGLIIGYGDVGQEARRGPVLRRSTEQGMLLGVAVGAAAGTIVAIDSEDWHDLGRGAAWGSLAGAAGGFIYGLLSGPEVQPDRGESGHSGGKVDICMRDGKPYLVGSLKF